jgi:uncharacterized protein YcbX
MNNNISISKLFVYPLKSGHEIELKESQVIKSGLLNDRLFLIVKKDNMKIITIRNNPLIYDILTTHIEGNIYCINVPNHGEYLIDISINNESDIIYDLSVQRIKTDVYRINDELLNKALSQYLGEDVIFVNYCKARKCKDTNLNFTEYLNENDYSLFADLSPILIISQESLDYVNEHLAKKDEKPVKDINFRPNIVLKGGIEPFYEDKINKILIGNIILRRIRYCSRCKLTKYDTESKKFNENMQPLNLLLEIRSNENGEAVFGQYFAVDILNNKDTNIKVGDIISID